MVKTHKGKWKDKGINAFERNSIYSKTRARAKTILKNRHKNEYKKIMKVKFVLQIKCIEYFFF